MGVEEKKFQDLQDSEKILLAEEVGSVSENSAQGTQDADSSTASSAT